MKDRESKNWAWALVLISLLSGVLLVVSLSLSTGIFNKDIFISYFKSPRLLVLNYLPILVFILGLYLATNKLGLSFFLIASLILVGGVGNRAKIIYRDDPLVMMDLRLLGEAKMMSQRYDIPINLRIIATMVVLLGLSLVVGKFFNYKLEKKKTRYLGLAALVLVAGLGFRLVYMDQAIYDKTGDYSVIDRWIASEVHQSKGFIYPFVHSGKDLMEEKPEGYNKKEAQAYLDAYPSQAIDPDKQVNIIGIMLEAYNDFSKFDLEFEEGVYDYFHQLQKESIHGNIVTNIFAGGTVDSERAYLAGYQNQPKYNKETNSFVWYFKDQGYITQAMHPVTGSFYNRRNVNEYLGFDDFYHGDNKYGEKDLFDKNFLPSIIEGFEAARDQGQPYFNYSLTYQNHGPYGKQKYHEKDYLVRKDSYDEDLYNIANNYFYGIKDTGENLEKLINYFQAQDEPVVVVLFGDHNPWMGEANSVYKMLDIDLNLGQEEGFRNYYETPYIIWGNPSAKKVLGKDLVGPREEIGSNYLMAQVFEELGYKGNSYMQALIEMKSKVPVQHKLFFKEDGIYKKQLDKYEKDYRDFVNAEYYYSRNKDKK